MNKPNTAIWLVITTLFAVVLSTFTLSHIVTHPWHEVPELGADGGKNIFTYLYHVLYGKGIWFEGMNYPYGEHITYTDGQPLLSVPLSSLNKRLTMGDALTIMWWTIALSYVLSIIYCFKILLRFSVKPLAAMCFAGLITLLSPQVFRISGHYALSLMCVLPMLFYFTLQYNQSGRYKYLIFIFFTALPATFMHPYYAAVSLVWGGLYSAGYLITHKNTWRKKLWHTAPLLLSLVAVFAIFGIYMKVSDPFINRPVTPYGILANCTTLKDVVISTSSPIWAFIGTHIAPGEIADGGDGRSYIGLTAIITLLVVLGIIVRNRFAT
ncbi:MAG: hypothetical protein H7257_02480, partial [Taibaiella sp.]|nr:hypothetical protein [Taibaiella sp.]